MFFYVSAQSIYKEKSTAQKCAVPVIVLILLLR